MDPRLKQDFFSLRILRGNSLRLPFYFQFVRICGFSVFPFFPREMKVSVRSLNIVCKLTNQCPESVDLLYISMKLLAVNCRCELKAKMACGVGKQNLQLIAELKGHEHVANAVGVNTCFCFCLSRFQREIRLFIMEMVSK